MANKRQGVIGAEGQVPAQGAIRSGTKAQEEEEGQGPTEEDPGEVSFAALLGHWLFAGFKNVEKKNRIFRMTKNKCVTSVDPWESKFKCVYYTDTRRFVELLLFFSNSQNEKRGILSSWQTARRLGWKKKTAARRIVSGGMIRITRILDQEQRAPSNLLCYTTYIRMRFSRSALARTHAGEEDARLLTAAGLPFTQSRLYSEWFGHHRSCLSRIAGAIIILALIFAHSIGCS